MAFDKDTGASAGKKSKRGSSKQINEIREVYSELLHNNKDKLQEWFDEVGKYLPVKYIELLFICLFSRPTSWKYEKSKWRRKWGKAVLITKPTTIPTTT